MAETGLGFSFLFALFQGASGYPATANDSEGYAQTIGNPNFPVFADGEGQIQEATPLIEAHPEICVLSPSMEILYCDSGHRSYEVALDVIRDHASDN